jgi:hypothetical protein
MAPPMPDALTLVSLETDLMGCWHSPRPGGQAGGILKEDCS